MELLDFPSDGFVQDFREKRVIKNHSSYLSRKIIKNDPNKINNSGTLLVNTTPIKLKKLLPKPLANQTSNEIKNHIRTISENQELKLSSNMNDVGCNSPMENVFNIGNNGDINDHDIWRDHFQLACLCAFSYFPLSKSAKKKDDYRKARKHFEYVLMMLTNLYETESKKILIPLCFVDSSTNANSNIAINNAVNVGSSNDSNNGNINDSSNGSSNSNGNSGNSNSNSINIIVNGVKVKGNHKRKKRKKRKSDHKHHGSSVNGLVINNLRNKSNIAMVKRQNMRFQDKFKQLTLNNGNSNSGTNKKKKKQKNGSLKLNNQRSNSVKTFEPVVSNKKSRTQRQQSFGLPSTSTVLKQSVSDITNNLPGLPALQQSQTDLYEDRKVQIREAIDSHEPNSVLNEGFVKLGYAYGCFLYDINEYNESLKSLLLCCEWYTREFSDPTSLEALLLPPATLFDDNNGITKINFRTLSNFVSKVINKVHIEFAKIWDKLNMTKVINDELNASESKSNELDKSNLDDKEYDLITNMKLLAQARYEFGQKCLQQFRMTDAKKQYRESIKILSKIHIEFDLKSKIQKGLNEIDNQLKKSQLSHKQRLIQMRNKRHNK